MPRRLRRLRFISQKLSPVIRPLPTRTNIMGVRLSRYHLGLTPILTTYRDDLKFADWFEIMGATSKLA
jgi:hypothetical protein